MDGNYEEAEPRSRSNLEPDPTQFGGNPHEESAHTRRPVPWVEMLGFY